MARLLLVSLPLFALACGPRSLRITMFAENNSGQEGFATLTATGRGATRIVVDIAAGAETAAQNAHVHEGRCGEIGAITVTLNKVERDPARPTRFVSTTNAMVDLDELLRGPPSAINVHNSRDNALYVSCGQLE